MNSRPGPAKVRDRRRLVVGRGGGVVLEGGELLTRLGDVDLVGRCKREGTCSAGSRSGGIEPIPTPNTRPFLPAEMG